MTTYLFNLITLFGGLALFLFGMDVMGKALERAVNDAVARTVEYGFVLNSLFFRYFYCASRGDS